MLLIGSTSSFPGSMSSNVVKKIAKSLHFKIMQYLALGLEGDFLKKYLPMYLEFVIKKVLFLIH